VGPKRARVGAPAAAARWLTPESLPRKRSARERTAARARRGQPEATIAPGSSGADASAGPRTCSHGLLRTAAAPPRRSARSASSSLGLRCPRERPRSRLATHGRGPSLRLSRRPWPRARRIVSRFQPEGREREGEPRRRVRPPARGTGRERSGAAPACAAGESVFAPREGDRDVDGVERVDEPARARLSGEEAAVSAPSRGGAPRPHCDPGRRAPRRGRRERAVARGGPPPQGGDRPSKEQEVAEGSGAEQQNVQGRRL